MKHIRKTLTASFLAFGILGLALLAGCSTAQTDAFVERVANFNRGVAAVDDAIAKVSVALYRNCKSAQTIAQAASDIAGSCTKASPVLTAGNAIIASYCSDANKVADIASAISATAATVSATKTQLAAAKKSCATGG